MRKGAKTMAESEGRRHQEDRAPRSGENSEVETVTFRAEHHLEDAALALSQFYRSEQLCDVRLRVGERTFRCHRIVLAAHSEYFRAMFTVGMAESQMDEIQLLELDPASVQLLIDFVYEGSVIITVQNVQALLTSAAFLHILPVRQACADFLKQHLCWNNCLGVGEFARMHGCTDLEPCVQRFCQQHFAEVVKSDEFPTSSLQTLERILQSDELNVQTEEDVFEAAMLWLRQQAVPDGDQRYDEYLPRLLSTVRLAFLPPKYLTAQVESNPHVRCSLRCRDLIDKAKNYHLLKPLERSPSVWQLERWRLSYIGYVFAAGGRGGSELEPRKSVERYSFTTNCWERMADMHMPRRHVGLTVAGGCLYAVGGHDGTGHLNSVEMYDPETNRWSVVAAMANARRGVGLGALTPSGPLYAAGGMNDLSCLRHVERYDVALNSWTEVSPMLTPRGGLGVSAIGGRIYAVGGNQGSLSLSTCEVYNPALDKWTLIKSMISRRAGIGMATWRGCLVVAGGFEDTEPLKEAEMYNPTTDTWSPLPPMKVCRGGVAIVSVANRVIAIGGHNGAKYLESVEMLCSANHVNDSVTYSDDESLNLSTLSKPGHGEGNETRINTKRESCTETVDDKLTSASAEDEELVWTQLASMETERAGAGVGAILNVSVPFSAT